MSIENAYREACKNQGLKPKSTWISVSVEDMQLTLHKDQKPFKTYMISTGRGGINNKEGSLATPLGLHRISEKIGADAEHGMVFECRKPIGKHFSAHTHPPGRTGMITSRIMRLQGLEPGINQGAGIDSFERYIYIHGTEKEDLIGKTQFSEGCICLTNDDIIDLFNSVDSRVLVYISET